MEELEMDMKAKPITFRVVNDVFTSKRKEQDETVKFEIEGGGDIVTSFVRKNEQEFFEFINDFDSNLKV
jgi:hypothetical protein